MKRIGISIITLIIVTVKPVLSQNISDTILEVDKKNRILINTTIIGTSIGAYYYLENTWWQDQSKDFHFDSGSDL